MRLDDLRGLRRRGGSVVDLLDLLAMENEDCEIYESSFEMGKDSEEQRNKVNERKFRKKDACLARLPNFHKRKHLVTVPAKVLHPTSEQSHV